MNDYELINGVGLVLGTVLALMALFHKVSEKKERQSARACFDANWFHIVCVGLLAILFLLTRFYRLAEIPLGFHVDEAAMSYNAFSLSHYGVDRYLDSYPVVVNNFGGGQSAVYTYFLAFLFKLFDYSILITRVPAVVFGALTAVCAYLLTRKELGKKSALLVLFLIVICPYFLMASRWGLDCNLFLGAFICALCVFTYAVERKKAIWYVVAGIGFGGVLYTYSLSYLIIPVFLGGSLLYLFWLRQIRVIDFLAFTIPLFLLALPLLLFVVVNAGYLEEMKIGLVTIPKFDFYRAGELSLSNITNNLNVFKIILIEDGLEYNAFSRFGTLYYCSIPLVFAGLIITIKKVFRNIKHKIYSVDFFVLFMFVCVLCCVLITYEPNINKANAIYVSLVYFIAVALENVWDQIPKIGVLITLVYVVCSIFFMNYYFTEYSYDVYPQKYFNDGIYANMPYIKELGNNHSRDVYIDPTEVQMPHIYTVIYELMSPYDFLHQSDPEKGHSYWNYKFYLPEEIDMDGIYMIYKDYNISYQKKLEKAGFSGNESRGYVIYSR